MIPFLKLLLLILTTSLIIGLRRWPVQAGISLILGLFLGKKIYPRLKFLVFVFAFIVIIQLLMKNPARGVASGLMIVNVSLAVLAYTSLTSAREMNQTWAFLGKKGRLLVTLTFNLIPVVLREAQNIRLIQLSRGRKTHPLAVVIPLLHRTLQRAEQLALVLEAKSATSETRTHTP